MPPYRAGRRNRRAVSVMERSRGWGPRIRILLAPARSLLWTCLCGNLRGRLINSTNGKVRDREVAQRAQVSAIQNFDPRLTNRADRSQRTCVDGSPRCSSVGARPLRPDGARDELNFVISPLVRVYSVRSNVTKTETGAPLLRKANCGDGRGAAHREVFLLRGTDGSNPSPSSGESGAN
jgi:hypothetical protein